MRSAGQVWIQSVTSSNRNFSIQGQFPLKLGFKSQYTHIVAHINVQQIRLLNKREKNKTKTTSSAAIIQMLNIHVSMAINFSNFCCGAVLLCTKRN